MKQKTFFAILSLLMLSLSSFAQAPVEGDVNEDGKVDEDDISAIIEIIKNGQNQPTYYWYVGTSIPTSTSGSGWTSLGTDLSSVTYIQANTSDNPDYTFPKFYVVLPTALNFKPYNADGSKDETAAWTSSTWSVNSAYTLWSLKDNTSDINSRFKK